MISWHHSRAVGNWSASESEKPVENSPSSRGNLLMKWSGRTNCPLRGPWRQSPDRAGSFWEEAGEPEGGELCCWLTAQPRDLQLSQVWLHPSPLHQLCFLPHHSSLLDPTFSFCLLVPVKFLQLFFFLFSCVVSFVLLILFTLLVEYYPPYHCPLLNLVHPQTPVSFMLNTLTSW